MNRPAHDRKWPGDCPHQTVKLSTRNAAPPSNPSTATSKINEDYAASAGEVTPRSKPNCSSPASPPTCSASSPPTHTPSAKATKAPSGQRTASRHAPAERPAAHQVRGSDREQGGRGMWWPRAADDREPSGCGAGQDQRKCGEVAAGTVGEAASAGKLLPGRSARQQVLGSCGDHGSRR